jgi:hypothetical protein
MAQECGLSVASAATSPAPVRSSERDVIKCESIKLFPFMMTLLGDDPGLTGFQMMRRVSRLTLLGRALGSFALWFTFPITYLRLKAIVNSSQAMRAIKRFPQKSDDGNTYLDAMGHDINNWEILASAVEPEHPVICTA